MIIKIELDGGLDKFISGANSAAAAVGSMEERIVRQAGIAGLPVSWQRHRSRIPRRRSTRHFVPTRRTSPIITRSVTM